MLWLHLMAPFDKQKVDENVNTLRYSRWCMLTQTGLYIITCMTNEVGSFRHPLSLSDCLAGSVIQFRSIPEKAHGMVGSPAEMRHLMGFWAQALKHRPVQANSGEAATVVEVQGGASALSSLQTTHA